MAALIFYQLSYRRRPILTTIAIFFLLAAIAVLLVWLVYHPTPPSFVVVDAAVLDMNATSSNAVSATIRFTVAAHNPNRRVSIYYDRMTAYVAYRNEAITPPLPLPSLFQGHGSTVATGATLSGAAVPVSRSSAAGLAREGAYGLVGLRLVLLGRLRWKAGAIRSGRYGLYVKCDLMVGVKKGHERQAPLLGNPDCSNLLIAGASLATKLYLYYRAGIATFIDQNSENK